MRFFRNFLDLRGHSRGNPRSGLIFMGGGGTILCVLADRQQCWNGTTYILIINLFSVLGHHKFQVYVFRLHIGLQIYCISLSTGD